MDRAQWLESRRAFLGASEVAAVCGLDPFKSALDVWASKMGLQLGEDSEAARIGHLLEPVLLEDYAKRTGYRLTQPGTVFHHDVPWAACTPDALAHPDLGESLDVQVKVVGRHMADEWDHKVPYYVQAQVQWELWVTDLPAADVVALIGGTDLRTVPIERNDAQISHVVEICSAFWRDYVETKRLPEIDASETARRVLDAIYPQQRGLIEAPDAMREMVERHQHLDHRIAELTEQRDRLRNEIRRAIGEHEGMTWPTGRVTWKTNKAGVRVLRIYTKE